MTLQERIAATGSQHTPRSLLTTIVGLWLGAFMLLAVTAWLYPTLAAFWAVLMVVYTAAGRWLDEWDWMDCLLWPAGTICILGVPLVFLAAALGALS